MKAHFSIWAATLFLAACSWNSGTRVFSGQVGTTQYVAATADLRFVFARPKVPVQGGDAQALVGAPKANEPDADPVYNVCVEPSPDVAKAISDAIKETTGAEVDGLKALGGTGASVTLNQGLSQTQNASLAQLGRRLATTQLMRDGVYRLCEGFANGAISNAEYGFALSRYGDTMVSLLSIEAISGMSDNLTVATTSSTATTPDPASGVSVPGAPSTPPKAGAIPKVGEGGKDKAQVQTVQIAPVTHGTPVDLVTVDGPLPLTTHSGASHLALLSTPIGGAPKLMRVAAHAPADAQAASAPAGALNATANDAPVRAAPAQGSPTAGAVDPKHRQSNPGAATPASASSDANVPAPDKDAKVAEANAIVTIQENYLRQSIYAPVVVLCVNVLGTDIRASDTTQLNKLQSACKDLLTEYATSAKQRLQNATESTGKSALNAR